jgi:DNA-binding MarR family transcriptional regulator
VELFRLRAAFPLRRPKSLRVGLLVLRMENVAKPKTNVTRDLQRYAVAREFIDIFDAAVGQVVSPSGSQRTPRKIPITPHESRALMWLGRQGTALMSEFARGIGIPLSTATHLVNRLVDKGLMIRERSEHDRRIVNVDLSSAGRKMDEQFYQRRLEGSRQLLSKLSADEQKALVDLLRKAIS